MGSSRARNSTRARKARSVKSLSKPKRSPVPPDVQEALRFVVMHLETIHAAATVAHDALTERQRITEEPVARVIRECVMNALSVQMDVLREMAGESGSHE